MTDCRFCGTQGAYDSGFTVECSNQNCRAFSQKQADLLMGSETQKDLGKLSVDVVQVSPDVRVRTADGR